MKNLFRKARGSTILVLSLLMALFFINVDIVKSSSLPAAVAAPNIKVLHEDPGRNVVTATSQIEIWPTSDFQAWCLENPAVKCAKILYTNISPAPTAETNLSPVYWSYWSLPLSEKNFAHTKQKSSFG